MAPLQVAYYYQELQRFFAGSGMMVESRTLVGAVGAVGAAVVVVAEAVGFDDDAKSAGVQNCLAGQT